MGVQIARRDARDRDDGYAVQDGGVDLEQAPRPRQQVRRLQQDEDVALCDGVEEVAQIGQIVRVQENLGARYEKYAGLLIYHTPAAIVDTIRCPHTQVADPPRVHGVSPGGDRGSERRCELVLQVACLGRGLCFVVADERGPSAVSDPLRVQRPRGTT
jgi:hypothetical protein